jgi:hypothetical protein
MAKKPKDKTLGQIKGDIKKGEEGKEAVTQTYSEIGERELKKTPLWVDFLLLVIVALLFGFAILGRSKPLSFVAGIALILVIIKIAYGQWTK